MSEPAAQENAPPPPPKKEKSKPPPSPKPPSDKNFTGAEMLDLALSPTEVGAVNFNILRMLLSHVLEKIGSDKAPVKVNDHEAHQVQNFKDYVQGAAVPSPMPGVLRINQQGPAPAHGQGRGPPRPPPDGSGQSPPSDGNRSRPPPPDAQGPQEGDQEDRKGPPRGPPQSRPPREGEPRKPAPGEPIATRKPVPGPSGPPSSPQGSNVTDEEVLDRIDRLERQFDKLNDLPTNTELLGGAGVPGHKSISVSEMWQIIQLNNRIAAAEAAIQKMASVIEDLAKNVGRVKVDAKTLTQDTQELALTSSQLQLQGQGLMDKYGQYDDVLNAVQKEINSIKAGWKQDRDNLEKVLGVDLGKIPASMKEREPVARKAPPQKDGEERSTQTFTKEPPKRERKPKETTKDADQLVAPEEIAKLTPAEIVDNITPDDLTRMTPAVYKQLSPEQKKALSAIRKSMKLAEPPKPNLGVDKMTDKELSDLPPKAILERMPFEEAMSVPKEVLARMPEQQREMVQKVIQRGPGKKLTSRRDLKRQKEDSSPSSGRLKAPPKLGVISMTQEQLQEIPPEDIAQKMPYEEAKSIPPNVQRRMTKPQQEALKKVLDAGPPPGYKEKEKPEKPVLGLASMDKEELGQVSANKIETIPYQEAKNIPPQVLQEMKPEQQAAIKKVVEAGPPPPSPKRESTGDQFLDEVQPKRPSVGKEKRPSRLSKEEIEMMAELPPFEIAEAISPEQAAAIPEEEMKKRFTDEQIEEIEKLKDEHRRQSRKPSDQSDEPTPPLTAEVVSSKSGSPTERPDSSESRDRASPRSPVKADSSMLDRRRSSAELEQEQEDYELEEEEEEGLEGGKKKGRPIRLRKEGRHKQTREQREHGHHRKTTMKTDHSGTDIGQQAERGSQTAEGKEQAPPLTLEECLRSLAPEEAANLAADAVQAEVEKQYKHLQQMQKQLAMDVQEKMEFVYQKLLKEIASQQQSSSPFTVEGPETCFGPGICKGHMMPAGMAICQVEGEEEKKKGKQTTPEGGMPETVCPGPGPCPGRDVCPYCQADATAKEALKTLEEPEKKRVSEAGAEPRTKARMSSVSPRIASDLDETLLQEMKSMMLLDLEKIRQEMKAQKLGVYDEQDILERLGAVWEALKILKNNEEALALKLAKQDVIIKKIPPKTMEKLHKIPDEYLDALATGDLGKIGPDPRRQTMEKGALDHRDGRRSTIVGPMGVGASANSEDIQTLFDNLANVIAECAEQKERIDQITDTARILESAMVTKQMLSDALGDKADRGLINTKVSYDEFGSTIDELNSQLHNLMMEGYQRNENWKKVTSDLAAELSEKLDRVELAPLRAFFKSHLKGLEDEVKDIVRIIKEPDPAGTRKKLLRDYNCLSCDRMVNISGVTNVPTLPQIGPISAGHPVASKRALEVHRMRMAKKCELSRRASGSKTDRPRTQEFVPNSATMANDMDVMHVVNRYTGGNQSNTTAPDITDAQRRKSKATDPGVLAATASGAANANASGRNSKTLNGGVQSLTPLKS